MSELIFMILLVLPYIFIGWHIWGTVPIKPTLTNIVP